MVQVGVRPKTLGALIILSRSSSRTKRRTALTWLNGIRFALMLIGLVALHAWLSTSPATEYASLSTRNPSQMEVFDVDTTTVLEPATTTTTVVVEPEVAPAADPVWVDRSKADGAVARDTGEEVGYGPYNGWAIPASIVACETDGTFSWDAYNSYSGAAGPYQLMPEHFGDDARNHSHAEQSAMAAKLWAGGAGASNWRDCLP